MLTLILNEGVSLMPSFTNFFNRNKNELQVFIHIVKV